MNQRLWKLGGAGVVMALAVSVYQKSGSVDRSAGRALAANTTVPATSRDGASTRSALPQTLSRQALEPAARDPFAAWQTTVVAKPVAPPIAPVEAPPPPPAPPPLNLRFAGRMTGPDGAPQVFLLSGETSLTATVGQTLPNGYRIEAVTARAVELSYPPLNTTARLDLPEPPQHEIR